MTGPPASTAESPDESVARVLLDVPLMHLDRPFDYSVPKDLSAQAVPGARVRVRFAGRRVNGYVLDRSSTTQHAGRLSPLDTVVSAEPVLVPAIAELARRVADHYIGAVADVLRLAIPPRHAKVEAEPAAPPVGDSGFSPEPGDLSAWNDYASGMAFMHQLASGAAVRVVATAPPATAWSALVAQAAVAVRGAEANHLGRSVLIVVPDHRDVAEVVKALADALPERTVTTLSSDLGPAKRYRAWLSVLRGESRIVVGTRAAMFAPVVDAGLVVVWDDGDDLHAELRAPYPHVREVLAMRSVVEDCAYLVIGRIRTAEGERLVRSGWAQALDPDRQVVRASGPTIRTIGADAEMARDAGATVSRLPGLALRAARDGLQSGPVLVQVPRAGYVPVVACQDCREVAHCARCHGPLRIASAGAAPVCRWCGSPRTDHHCAACGSARLRAVRTGSVRTAEELGRGFPGVSIITSGREGVVATVPDRPALIVATPGAEPVAVGGYAAALLLDGDQLLHRGDLRADEEALRRWMNAASLVRAGAPVVITADPLHPSVQALVRWDPQGFAQREFDARAAAHLPPAARVVSLDGTPAAISEIGTEFALPPGAEILGPVPLPYALESQGVRTDADPARERVRLILRVPIAQGASLAAELRGVQSVRSARKTPEHVTVRVDPLELL